MLSFQLTEEQQMLRDAVKKFASQELRPHMRDCENSRGVPDAIRSLAREIGLLLIDYPEPIGGAGLDLLTRIIVTEELAYGDAGITLYLDQPGPAGYALLECGRLDQQIEYLHPFAEPSHLGRAAFCFGEADPASWEGHLQTTATETDDGYTITGEKPFVVCPEEADWFCVAAALEDAGEEGPDAVRFFIVPAGADGLRIGEDIPGLGCQTCRFADVHFDEVSVPADNMLDGTTGRTAIENVLSRARLVNAARLIGIVRAANDHAIDYAQSRTAFGDKIGSKQGIAFPLADDRTRQHAARWVVWNAAWEFDRGEEATTEASLATLQATEAAVTGTINAVQTLGGLGFMKDAPVEKWMRDARTLANMNGTPQTQSRIAGRRFTTQT